MTWKLVVAAASGALVVLVVAVRLTGGASNSRLDDISLALGSFDVKAAEVGEESVFNVEDARARGISHASEYLRDPKGPAAEHVISASAADMATEELRFAGNARSISSDRYQFHSIYPAPTDVWVQVIRLRTGELVVVEMEDGTGRLLGVGYRR
jgi:hypothetical protein